MFNWLLECTIFGYENKYNISKRAREIARASGNGNTKTYEDTVNTVLDIFYADIDNTKVDGYHLWNDNLPNIKFWVGNKWYAITMKANDRKYEISRENLGRIIQLVEIVEKNTLNKSLNIDASSEMLIAGNLIPTNVIIESIKKTHPQYLV